MTHTDLIAVLRLLIATLLGFAIGFERKLRLKEAGMRTHSIVSLGSCLLMLVSLYAFGDNVDTSRVAAQIVSGIGFLGAGMIMFKGQSGIHGLTTAAGIWVTAGVGMAIGGGMYLVGLIATVLIILIQCILHFPIKVFRNKRFIQLKIVFENTKDENEIVKELFKVTQFTKVKAVKDEDKILFTTYLTTDKIVEDVKICEILQNNSFIKSIERVEDE